VMQSTYIVFLLLLSTKPSGAVVTPFSECPDTKGSDDVLLIQKHVQVGSFSDDSQSSQISKDLPGRVIEMQGNSPDSLSVTFTSAAESDEVLEDAKSLYSLQDLPGCPACDSQSKDTCGRCMRVGYKHWEEDWPGSRLFEVQNLIMRNGTASFAGANGEQTLSCGSQCHPTWEYWPTGGHNWAQKDSLLEVDACSPELIITQPALVVNWRFPHNVHHFYMETVFATFMTVAHIAEIHGCPAEAVKVFVNAGFTETPFKPLWDVFANGGNSMNDMNGCYKQSFFGHMSSDYLRFDGYVTYDSTLSSWMSAYRSQVRHALVSPPSFSQTAQSLPIFLFVDHLRTPTWMKNITWNTKDVVIRPVDFAALPIKDQFSQVAQANGFVGVAGSGLAQQIFLPVGSSVLQVTALEPVDSSDLAGRGKCGAVFHLTQYRKGDGSAGTEHYLQDEGAARCYSNAAIHFGNNLLNWRWCKPKVNEEPAAFSQEDAQAVFKLLLSISDKARSQKSAHLCTVMNDRSFSKSWPQCDSLVVAPILQPNQRCGTLGVVGKPFAPKENRTVFKYCLTKENCV